MSQITIARTQTSATHPVSWWAAPEVQRDRAAFAAAVAEQQIRWRDMEREIRGVMAGIGYGEWKQKPVFPVGGTAWSAR